MKINKQVVIGVLFFVFPMMFPAQAADEAEVRGNGAARISTAEVARLQCAL